jgi:hypothetical protein
VSRLNQTTCGERRQQAKGLDVKVKDGTRDRLVVETFAWRFGLIMLLGGFIYAALNEHDGGARWRSIVAILAFAVPAWGMSYRTVVIFDRMRGVVTLEERRVGWHPIRTVRIEDVVAIERLEWMRQWSPAWRVELKLREGDNVPLLRMYTAGEDQQAAVAAAAGRFLGVPVIKRRASPEPRPPGPRPRKA